MYENQPADVRQQAVLDTCMDLFWKMTESPFLVTVINVAVTNFVTAVTPLNRLTLKNRDKCSMNMQDSSSLERNQGKRNKPTVHIYDNVCDIGGSRQYSEEVEEIQMRKAHENEHENENDELKTIFSPADMFCCKMCGVFMPKFCEDAHIRYHKFDHNDE